MLVASEKMSKGRYHKILDSWIQKGKSVSWLEQLKIGKFLILLDNQFPVTD